MSHLESKTRYGIIFLFFLFTLFFVPFFYVVGNLGLVFWGLKNFEESVNNGDLQRSYANALLVKSSSNRVLNLVEILHPLSERLTFLNQVNEWERLLKLAATTSEGVASALSVTEEGQKILSSILKGEKAVSTESWRKMSLELGLAQQKFSEVSGLLQGFSGRERLYGPRILEIKENLPQVRAILTGSNEALKILPLLLGTKERKTYLVTFQNSAELRPTGGFIGSYGLMTLEKGTLSDFEVQDVYFADGQLRGHVEPPEKLKEFLGQAGWYLRDSNWDPDFPRSALKASWFLEKETGRTVDGVVAINLGVAEKLLEVLGEIYLPDYEEKVNAKNFFERAQFHNEVGFFPGSTAKKDFLGAVSAQLFERIKTANQKDLAKVAIVLYQSLQKKDIMMTTNDLQVNKTINKLGWDGGIESVKCTYSVNQGQSVKCFRDYLMMVEANVGINKANYFLERKVEVKTQISQQGKVTKNLLIFYQNNSQVEVFPGGKYKNYLRIYAPLGSSLVACKVGGQECLVKEEVESDKKVFGFLVEVPVGERRRVEIDWKLPSAFDQGQYHFLLQKQSGIKDDPLLMTFSYPDSWEGKAQTKGVLTGQGFLLYNTDLSYDRSLILEFKRSN